MTNETQDQTQELYDFSTDPHGFTKEDIIGEDFLLDFLLTLNNGEHNDSAGYMALTVAIDGVVVSGVAISAKEWRRRMTESLGSVSEQYGNAFNTFATSFADRRAEVITERIAGDLPLPAARYVHLRDAYVIAGSSAQKFHLWRGNLSKLSGWSFGSVTPPEESKGE